MNPAQSAQASQAAQPARSAAARPDGISVVVCTYSDERWTEFGAAVREVRAQLQDGDEVIVVVDYNPALKERVEQAFPSAVVVGNDEERGLSGARNTGLRAAYGAVTVFLDDDATPKSGWLEAIRRRFTDQRVVAVGGAVQPRWEGGAVPQWFPEEFGWVVGCDYEGLPRHGEVIRNPIGANMAIRRDVFDVVGGFSALIGRVGSKPVGCEETDLCIRVRQAMPDSLILRDTSAEVSHYVPRSRQTVQYFLRRCYFEGRSKAVLADRLGSRDSLESERTYVRRVLIGGVFGHLGTARHGDLHGLSRAGLIGLGTLVTAAGFASGRGDAAAVQAPARPDAEAAAAADGWLPAVVLDYDLRTGRIGRADSWPATRIRIRLLAFDGESPVGLYDVPLPETGPAGIPAPGLVAAALGVRLVPPPVTTGGGPATGAAVTGTPAAVPPPEGEPLISVVIPTAGRPDEIARCLESLRSQTWSSFEILVIDNNPTHDAVLAAVAPVMARDDRIRLIHHPEGGSSGARNRGMREAAGELIAATDDDVICHPNWLSALVRAFDDPTVDCVTGLVVPMGLNTRAQELFEEFGGFGKGFVAKRYDLAEHRAPGRLYPYTVGTYGSGNNVAFRARLVKEVGEYDPLLGPGSVVRAGQDIDLFLRVLFAGGTIAYEPKAVVRHEHRTTMEALETQIYNYGRGLSAVILKQMLDDPRRLVDIGTRLPGAVYYLLAPNSEKNVARGAEYPAEIRRAELRGLADGALVYLRSRYSRGGTRR